jgi:hypothetical protein
MLTVCPLAGDALGRVKVRLARALHDRTSAALRPFFFLAPLLLGMSVAVELTSRGLVLFNRSGSAATGRRSTC